MICRGCEKDTKTLNENGLCVSCIDRKKAICHVQHRRKTLVEGSPFYRQVIAERADKSE